MLGGYYAWYDFWRNQHVISLQKSLHESSLFTYESDTLTGAVPVRVLNWNIALSSEFLSTIL